MRRAVRSSRSPGFSRLLRVTFLALVVALTGMVPVGTAGRSATEIANPRLELAGRRSVLTFGQRVALQRQIEEVYWRHRIWPAENPGPKPTLDAVLSSGQVRERVDDSLRLSNALQDLWSSPITGAQLQAEMERQARDSRQPEMLRELWAALGNDPHLIAEVLARPVLAERLALNWQAEVDGHEGSMPFEAWWQGVRDSLGAEVVEPEHAYRLPAIGARPQAQNTWTPTFALPEADLKTSAVWTGTEMIVWGGTEQVGGGTFNSGSRYDPALDTWRSTSGVGAPFPRKQHSAVWTGTEMIVWGGCGLLDEHRCQIDSGGRYNPATDTWRPTSEVGTPGNRIDHTAIWTGQEMLVWGGCAFVNDACEPTAVGSDGGRYDPATDTWGPITAVGAPDPRIFHTAVWTGREMIVWGGDEGDFPMNTGGRYDPATDAWVLTNQAGAPSPRYDHGAVWTGREMIVWGGCTANFCDQATRTGGRYRPGTNSWRPTPIAGAPSARATHTAVWTGTVMVVWGGCSTSFCGNFLDTGGRFRPAANSWRPTSQVGAPEPRNSHVGVWTGSLMIVWGGNRPDPFVTPRTGGRYDPASDTWTPTNANESPTARASFTMVWTGVEMIVWGGDDRFFPSLRNGGRYSPVTDSWRPTSLAGAPAARHRHTAVWTGQEMIVWGGGPTLTNSGGRYDPTTNTWAPTSTTGAPEGRSGHSAIWTGTEMIVWGGSVYDSPWTKTGGRYDPGSNSWKPTRTSGAPPARSGPSAVWTGTKMIVWGGSTANGNTNTGGRYDPASNSWSPTSTAGAPSPRGSHAAVWTGSRMIIWGGSRYESTFTFFDDGALYDPTTDSWTATTMVSAPSERAAFSYVWTGTEMIVWGGCSGPADCSEGTHTGGHYDPATDTWVPTPVIAGPSARCCHRGIWSGTEMIVWGGLAHDYGTYTHTGGRYLVSTDPDTDPPVISGVGAVDLGTSSATIVWTTDEGATSQVEYGLSTEYGSFTPLDSNLVLDHAVTLSGLADLMLYHFRVHSADLAGNESVSGDFTFNTIDLVEIKRADYYSPFTDLLVVRATSTDHAATLSVYVAGSDQLIGVLTNMGGGRYGADFHWEQVLSQIDVVSTSGGEATRVVGQICC